LLLCHRPLVFTLCIATYSIIIHSILQWLKAIWTSHCTDVVSPI